jgi:glycosyltransferase involved in cell wall biosynthesis
MKSVVIIDPKGVIPSGGIEVIKRHEKYSNTLEKISNGEINLMIITNSINERYIQTSNLKIFSTNTSRLNLIKFVLQANKIIQCHQFESLLLVAGDPWEPAWCANQIKKRFIDKKISIEVQAHGDFADKSWKYLSFRNFFRYFVMFYGYKIASTLRVTSETQKNNFARTMKIPIEKMKVIPVYMDLKKVRKSTTKSDRICIGLVGRIHFDRGLKEFTKLLKSINSQNEAFKVLIAGGGPKINWLIRKTNYLKSGNRVCFLGNLNHQDLQNFWSQINVLVSMAPLESFGRAMRESIVSGVPVWAIRSAGSLELHRELRGDGIYFIEPKCSDKELLNELRTISGSLIKNSSITALIESDKMNLKNLVKNWILNVDSLA